MFALFSCFESYIFRVLAIRWTLLSITSYCIGPKWSDPPHYSACSVWVESESIVNAMLYPMSYMGPQKLNDYYQCPVDNLSPKTGWFPWVTTHVFLTFYNWCLARFQGHEIFSTYGGQYQLSLTVGEKVKLEIQVFCRFLNWPVKLW